MGLPGYYLTTDSPPNIVTFLTAERPGSSPEGRRAGAISRIRTKIKHRTEEGVLWTYKQYEGRKWDLTFRIVTEAQLDFFETLDLAVDGDGQFYFIPDVDESPMQEYLVRKEDSFLPTPIEFASYVSGNNIAAFDYHLIMEEESAAAYILA